MKQILIFAILLFPILGFSQFNVNTSVVHNTCNGNGSVSIDIDNATIGYNYDIEIQLDGSNSPADNKTNAVSNVSNNSFSIDFSGLTAGTWSINVIESDGSNAVDSYNSTFEVLDNTPSTPAFTATTSVVCGMGNVDINVTNGTFTSYSLINLGTGPDYPSQTSTTFSDIEAGDYRVTAVYACGTITQDITVSSPGSNYTFSRNSQDGTLFNRLSSCGVTKHKVIVKLNGNNIPADRFPLNVNYKVYDATGNLLHDQTETFTQYWNDDYYVDLPHADGNKVVATITDACNVTKVREDIMQVEKKVRLSPVSGNCGGKYYYVDFENMATPITIKFTSYPPGFVPSEIRSEFDDTTYTATIDEFDYIDKRILLGGTDNVFPEGDYTIEFSDNCGTTTVISKNISPRQELFINAQVHPACDGVNVTTKILLTNTTAAWNKKAGTFQDVEFTSGPAAFSSAYPVSLNPYLREGEVLIENLPPGTYTVQSSANSCGFTESTELTIENERVLNFEDNITYRCASFDYNFTIESNHLEKRVYFQRFNGTSWVNIFNQQVGGIAPKSFESNNLTTIGLYRVALQYEYYSPAATNNTGTLICDLEILKEFEFNGSPLALNDYYVNACGNSGTFDLILDATGVGALDYKILSKDGDTSYATSFQQDPVFAGLSGGTYKIEIKDECDKTTFATLNVQTDKSPRVLAANLCDGETGTLRTSGLSQFVTEWTKDGQPINDSRISFADNVLTFSPYEEADHIGTYEASITYPNAATCEPIKAEIILTTDTDTNPSAGVGQTIGLTSNDINGTVNMFDYLTGTYDTFGVWSEVTNSNLLKGDEWFAEFASTGTYEFTYTVEGTCSGEDTATVIINFVSVCDKPFNSQQADTFTSIGISNLKEHRESNWPTSVPNGFITLESESKGFVITRIEDPENAIAEPKEGMLVFDIDEKNGKGCFKLFNGTTWDCIQKACNN